MSASADAAPAPMRYTSTRNPAARAGFSQALLEGLAPDGGLYVPRAWPHLDLQGFGDEADLPRIASVLLAPFLAGDALNSELPEITAEAFDFPAPLVPLDADGRL